MTPRRVAAQVARKLGGPVVVQKGAADAISNGRQNITCTLEGSPRRAGGQVRPPASCDWDALPPQII